MAGYVTIDPAGLRKVQRAFEQTKRSLAQTARPMSPPPATLAVGGWRKPQPNRTASTRDKRTISAPPVLE